MFTSLRPVARTAVIALLLGSTIAAPAFAADTASGTNPGSSAMPKMKMTHKHSAEDMQKMVEDRIQTLHAKLKITPEQENDWKTVADAMRESEKSVGDLVKQRHENKESMSAVDDLQSYQSIAQAHADGLKNVTASFETLYNEMPDDQKKVADTEFGNFEGHMHGGATKKGSM